MNTLILEPVLTAQGMRSADAVTINEAGFPGFALMETAGRAVVTEVERLVGSIRSKRFAVVCGPGNNGGDGLICARVILAKGGNVIVFLAGDHSRQTPDTALALRLLQHAASNAQPDHFAVVTRCRVEEILAVQEVDCWIDALLGTGLSSAVRAPQGEIIEALNRRKEPVVSVDIASGLDASTGRALGVAVRADVTVTMAALKTGHLTGDGVRLSGKVITAEIGIPRSVLEHAVDSFSGARRVTADWVRRILPTQSGYVSKFDAGYLTVVAGSRGLTGAAVLATRGAEKVGAGGVICACPEAVQEILAAKLTTAMPFPLPQADDSGIDISAITTLTKSVDRSRALLVGCGLGRATSTGKFVRELVSRSRVPVVVDADGLDAVSGVLTEMGESRNGDWVITPHAGEFARLYGTAVPPEKRIEAVREVAIQWKCIVLLKGFPSVIGTPDGCVFLNPTGNPAAATAGSGDVLAGVIAGLIAQGLPTLDATLAGIYLAGATVDRLVRTHYGPSILASDIVSALPASLTALAAEG